MPRGRSDSTWLRCSATSPRATAGAGSSGCALVLVDEAVEDVAQANRSGARRNAGGSRFTQLEAAVRSCLAMGATEPRPDRTRQRWQARALLVGKLLMVEAVV